MIKPHAQHCATAATLHTEKAACGSILLQSKVKGFIGPEPQRNLPGKWLGEDDMIEKLPYRTKVLIAIGDPEVRSKLAHKINENNLKQHTFIHPSAYLSPESIERNKTRKDR